MIVYRQQRSSLISDMEYNIFKIIQFKRKLL